MFRTVISACCGSHFIYHVLDENPSQDLGGALDQVDQGMVEIKRVDDWLNLYDWVVFYLGDTEVGAVFKADGKEMVAEIGDGDIMACFGMLP